MVIHTESAIRELSKAITAAIKQGDQKGLARLQAVRSELEAMLSDFSREAAQAKAEKVRSRTPSYDDDEEEAEEEE